MKKLVILVPGSKAQNYSIPNILLRYYCRYFGIDINGDPYFDQLANYLKKNTSLEVQTFNWSGGFSESGSLKPAALELAKLIEDNQDKDEIILIGKSLGGKVAELATKLNNSNVTKLIYISTPHKTNTIDLPDNIKIINIISDEDNYIKFAKRVLYRNFKDNKITNGVNMVIPNLRHSMFNEDTILQNNKYKSLFPLYEDLITN